MANAPGIIRDAVFAVLAAQPEGMALTDIRLRVKGVIPNAPDSSIRSILNISDRVERVSRARYRLRR